jgi:hypothetical protein
MSNSTQVVMVLDVISQVVMVLDVISQVDKGVENTYISGLNPIQKKAPFGGYYI